MIISEKQIMQLMGIAEMAATIDNITEDYRSKILNLLISIKEQQSEKLREIR